MSTIKTLYWLPSYTTRKTQICELQIDILEASVSKVTRYLVHNDLLKN